METASRPFPINVTPELEIIPLGGLGEFGQNMMVYRAGGRMLIVDAGAAFPDASLPGVELVIPDLSYLREHAAELDAIVLTHAHEDHIGALPFVLREFKAPVLGSRYTLEVVRSKMAEHPDIDTLAFDEVAPGEMRTFGAFTLSFLQVNHSTAGALAIVLDTPAGTIVHTGDFRIDTPPAEDDHFDYAGFAALGKRGVLALLSDSTNVERPGFTASEKDVAHTLDGLVEDARGRVIVALFASSVPRLRELARVAERHGRLLHLAGRSLVESIRIARELKLLAIPDSMLIGAPQLEALPPERVMIVLTGSQGEPRSALARVAALEHRDIKVRPGDTVIFSSRIIPGHERSVGALINTLSQQGAEVITERTHHVHTSGHAQAGELATMLSLVRPAWFIPIHGEYYQLRKHGRLAVQCGVPEERVILATNGQIVSFAQGQGGHAGTVITGRQFIDGECMVAISMDELRERRKIGETGLVIVLLLVNRETGAILHGPEFVTRGFVYELPSAALNDGAAAYLLSVVDDLKPDKRRDLDVLKEEVRLAVRRHLGRVVGRKPVVIPLILSV